MSAATPSLPTDVGPTRYLTVAGTELPLPTNARLDLAYLWTYPLTGTTGGAGFTQTVGGDVYEVPVNVHAALAASNQAANRVVTFIQYDVDGSEVLGIPASAVQTANTTYRYDFFVGTGLAYGAVGSRLIATIPAILGTPGEKWQLIADAIDRNDAWSQLFLQVIRIPTGPGHVQPTNPLAATPLLT